MVESLAQTNRGNRRVANRFVGIRDFSYLTLGIRDFEAKSGRGSELKVSREVGCQYKKPRDYEITQNFGPGLRD